MTLTVIIGPRGSGKTLLSTMFALDDLRKVYSNYKLNIENYNDLTPSVLDSISEPSLILIDEAYVWLESRVSSSHVNRYMSQILFQSRKLRLDFVLTAQLFHTIDNRFRDLSDYVIQCKKLDDGFAYEVIDMYLQRVVYRFKMPKALAESLYKYYDTYQRVSSNSFIVSEMESDPKKMNEVVDGLVERLIIECNGRSVKRQYVDDFCVRNGVPLKVGRYVYNRYVTKVV